MWYRMDLLGGDSWMYGGQQGYEVCKQKFSREGQGCGHSELGSQVTEPERALIQGTNFTNIPPQHPRLFIYFFIQFILQQPRHCRPFVDSNPRKALIGSEMTYLVDPFCCAHIRCLESQ